MTSPVGVKGHGWYKSRKLDGLRRESASVKNDPTKLNLLTLYFHWFRLAHGESNTRMIDDVT